MTAVPRHQIDALPALAANVQIGQEYSWCRDWKSRTPRPSLGFRDHTASCFVKRFQPRLKDPEFPRGGRNAHYALPGVGSHPASGKIQAEGSGRGKMKIARTMPHVLWEPTVKLIWKFNLVLLGIFLVGFADLGLRFVQRPAKECARGSVAACPADDGSSARVAHLHQYADQAAARNAVEVRLPAADGAGVRRHRAVQRRAQDAPGLRVQGGDAQPHQPARPRERLGGRRRPRSSGRRPTTTELVGERDTPTGRSLYLARPIQIKNGACLVCHSTVDAAPKTMLDIYGGANGFGWKLNEIIGAQVVSVPMTVPIARASATFTTFMISLAAVFLATFVLLNVMLAHDRHPARHPPGGNRRPGQPRQPRGGRVPRRAARMRSAC